MGAHEDGVCVQRESGRVGGSRRVGSRALRGRDVVRVGATALLVLPVDVVRPWDGGVVVLLGWNNT